MYSPYYSYGYSSYSALTALPIAMVIAIGLAIVLYCTFLRKENEGKFTGWKEVAYNFFNFNKFYLEEILKLFYILVAAVITAFGFVMLFVTPATGIIVLIVGNVALRISYEAIMMFVILCKKTVSIDRKLDKVVAFYGDDFDEGDCSGECDSCSEDCGSTFEEDEADNEFTCSGDCGSCGESCSDFNADGQGAELLEE